MDPVYFSSILIPIFLFSGAVTTQKRDMARIHSASLFNLYINLIIQVLTFFILYSPVLADGAIPALSYTDDIVIFVCLPGGSEKGFGFLSSKEQLLISYKK